MKKKNTSKYKIIKEGLAEIKVPVDEKISKELPTFYNPVMKHNRDITIKILNAIPNLNMQIASPLEGTGARAIRIIKELPKNKVKYIEANDISKEAAKTIKENIKKNKISSRKVKVFNKDANMFLLEGKGYDYIDIDPFGSPNKFLESAIVRLSREGILAVTATDTACLCGTFPATCKRKYWATPLRNEQMHEVGLRILIRKVQLIGAHNEKALTPILGYSKEHYFRAFFRCDKGKNRTDDIISQHQYFLYCNKCMNHKTSKYNKELCCGQQMEIAGPIWIGPLKDISVVNKIKDDKFIDTIKNEMDVVGIYDIHKICEKNRLKIPRNETLIDGKEITGTQFSQVGLKSKKSIQEILDMIRKEQ